MISRTEKIAWWPPAFKSDFYIFSYNDELRKIYRNFIEKFLLYYTSLNGNKKPIRYEFHDGVKPNWYNGNMVWNMTLMPFRVVDFFITNFLTLHAYFYLQQQKSRLVKYCYRILRLFTVPLIFFLKYFFWHCVHISLSCDKNQMLVKWC